MRKIKHFMLNFGPQHPSAHGVLRLILELDGEVIVKADPHIGLLHRGTEKLIEHKTYLQALPYFDRLDYVSMMAQEHLFTYAIETLLPCDVPRRAKYIRVIFLELTRILNHLLSVTTHAIDVGALTPMLWAFEEREKIMEFYERVSGARMHAAFYRPNEVNLAAISPILLEDILNFIRNCFTTLNEMHNVLTYNKVWKQRLVGIGAYDQDDCVKFGLTGVMARCCGIKRDLRLDRYETYGNYYYLNFRGYIGTHGDCYDRFLLRMCEMSESLNLINQLIFKILKNSKKKTNEEKKKSVILGHKILKNLQKKEWDNHIKNKYNNMEDLIKHFKYWSEGFPVQSGWTQRAVESPKGEFCVSMIADNSSKPYKCKVRSPAYHHLQILPQLVVGHFLADLVTLIGSVDIVFGEIDR